MTRHSRFAAALCLAVAGICTLTILLAGSGAAGASPPGKPPTSPPPNGVEIIGDAGHIVDVFKSARCSVRSGVFTATARYNPGRLLVRVKPFSGFKRYPLEAGKATGPYVPSFVERYPYQDNENGYSSNFVPPHEVAQGGAIDFSDNGTQVGVGFMPVFDSNGSRAVIIDGVMTCHYAKLKK